ncbi:hypothetical protein QFZ51_003416 [Chitinophaga sp. W3I9]|uniref:hypothetical protein n=1 Tax=Chitinophaga sp. W3I9 TaxID=3373924 RepID=UPI003D1AB262
MKQQYEILTTIRYRHDFFQALSYEGIGIRMSAATGKQLLNADLMLKQQASGFLLLYNTLGAGKRTRSDLLQDNTMLTFEVILKDPLFYNYTAIDAGSITTQCFMFGNDAANAPGVLHRHPYADAADLYGTDTLTEPFFTKPFGLLTLVLNDSLQDNYEIRFQARSTYWCYYLMSEQLAALPHPVILNNSGISCFSEPLLAALPERNNVPVLVSNDPIPLSDRTPDILKLANRLSEEDNKHKIIISPLPSPEVNRISAAGRSWYTNGKTYSEIFLY